MEFSVIIPVRNRPQELLRCLAGIWANDYPLDRYEVIVVDNGSTDETPRLAATAGATVLNEPVPNRCQARNHGAREARGRWLAFIDSDCVPDPHWLEELHQAIQALGEGEPVAALAGLVRPAPPATPVEEYIARRRWIDQEKFLTPGRRFSPPFAATANLAIRRDVYLATGGLDAALRTAGEDADWCWRAAAAGWQVRYVPRAAVTHYHRSSLGGMWRQSYHYGIGQVELFAKWHAAWGARVWLEPRRWVWALKGLLKAPWRLLTGRTPFERREPFYDCLANTAMALGRVRAAVRHRLPVL